MDFYSQSKYNLFNYRYKCLYFSEKYGKVVWQIGKKYLPLHRKNKNGGIAQLVRAHDS